MLIRISYVNCLACYSCLPVNCGRGIKIPTIFREDCWGFALVLLSTSTALTNHSFEMGKHQSSPFHTEKDFKQTFPVLFIDNTQTKGLAAGWSATTSREAARETMTEGIEHQCKN